MVVHSTLIINNLLAKNNEIITKNALKAVKNKAKKGKHVMIKKTIEVLKSSK